MLKSLVARAGDELMFALVPADAELSLERLAAASGAESARMAERADAERATGYRVGGISPFGSRTALRVFLDVVVIAPAVWLAIHVLHRTGAPRAARWGVVLGLSALPLFLA